LFSVRRIRKETETFIKESTESHSDIPEIESSLNNETFSRI
jgi:hypothetical protein